MTRILMVAGESSGDRYGAHLIRALRDRTGDLTCFGIGGEQMVAAGFEPLHDSRDFSVVGFVEILSRLPMFFRAMRDLRRAAEERRPDLGILIDYPGFNLRLAPHLKAFGIPILYFVSPQVWAWRKGRIRTLARCVDTLAVILPFEEEIYRAEGMEVEFVGHPLIDLAVPTCSRREARDRLGLRKEAPIVGLLPGSRPGECRRILPVLLEAGKILREKIPGVQFLLPVAESLDRRVVEEMVRKKNLQVTLVEGGYYDALNACDVAAIASGTATLEAALLGIPMVIVYRVNPLTYWLTRRLVTVEMAGQANLVLGRRVVTELIQGDCRPGAVAEELRSYLENADRRNRIRADLVRVRQRLGEGGSFQKTAALAMGLLSRKRPVASPAAAEMKR